MVSQKCRGTVIGLRRASRDSSGPEVSQEDARKNFKRVIRRAKRHFLRYQVDGFFSCQEVFQALKDSSRSRVHIGLSPHPPVSTREGDLKGWSGAT